MSKKETVPIETEGKLAQLNQIEQRIAEAIKNAGKSIYSFFEQKGRQSPSRENHCFPFCLLCLYK